MSSEPGGTCRGCNALVKPTGQSQAHIRAPLPLTITAILLFINFRSFAKATILMGTSAFALVGSTWLMCWQNFNSSIATGVGFIAPAGVAVEIRVIMLAYLNQAWSRTVDDTKQQSLIPEEENLKKGHLAECRYACTLSHDGRYSDCGGIAAHTCWDWRRVRSRKLHCCPDGGRHAQLGSASLAGVASDLLLVA